MPFDIAQLAEGARAALHRLLAAIPSHRRTPKPLSLGLVLDQRLKSAVSLVTDVQALRAEGVEKFYQLLPSKLDSPCTTLAYVIRAKPSITRLVASQIRGFATTHPGRALFVYFLPSATPLCQRILEEEGVYGNIAQIGDCDIDLLPFDRDVLSLENELSFPECSFDEDYSSLHSVASSLLKIQQQFGKFPSVCGKGQCSRLVMEIFMKLQAIQTASSVPSAARPQQAAPQPTFVSTSREKSAEPSPQIDHVILLDRSVDLITPCVTQLTYEGLIDEIFGIQNNAIEIDAAILRAGERGTKTKMVLNSTDGIFADLRYRNFAAVPALLNAKAKTLLETLKDKPNASTPLSEIRSFVLRLSPTQSDLASLQRHIYLSEHIAAIVSDDSFHKHLQIEQELLAGNRTESTDDYIEQCIDKLSLRSHTCGGYSNKRYAWLKKELLQTYGYEHMLSLPRLESVGLLREKDGKDAWPTLKRAFRLLVPEVNETDPNDIAYVYSGYAPMSIRLVQYALRPGGWRVQPVEEALRLLPGPVFGEATPAKSPEAKDAPQKTVLVYFVGGVTFAEIEALRFLSSQSTSPFTFLVATTKIIGGDPFFNSLVETFD